MIYEKENIYNYEVKHNLCLPSDKFSFFLLVIVPQHIFSCVGSFKPPRDSFVIKQYCEETISQ